jgi:uncharacterized protein (DUF2062 family)
MQKIMAILLSAVIKKYKQQILKLKQHCIESDSKKTALALTLGICIGIIPFLGITFITVTIVGVAFRLNQFVLQTTHLLVSPLQVIFIPIFMKAGQRIFLRPSSHLINNSASKTFTQFGHLVVYGLIVWFIFSVIIGYLLYRLWMNILSRNSTFRNAVSI